MSRIYHIGVKFAHHANPSGYVRLTDYVAGAVPIGSGFVQRFMNLSFRSLPRWQGALWRRIARASPIEWAILPRMFFAREPAIYHFLNPENAYKLCSRVPRQAAKIVCTFHQPAEWYRNLAQDPTRAWMARGYERIDAAIALGTSQMDALRMLTRKENIFMIPHGIDTDYYVQRPAEPQQKTVLSVGSWKRDFALLRNVAESIGRLDPAVEFRIVVPKRLAAQFSGLSNVRIYHDLPDEALLGLYHSSSVIFLPLLDSVANNALLEGMSCGIPCVITDVGCVREYASEDHAIMIPGNDAKRCVDGLMTLLNDAGLQKRFGTQARENALRFDWRVIAGKVAELYERVVVQ